MKKMHSLLCRKYRYQANISISGKNCLNGKMNYVLERTVMKVTSNNALVVENVIKSQ